MTTTRLGATVVIDDERTAGTVALAYADYNALNSDEGGEPILRLRSGGGRQLAARGVVDSELDPGTVAIAQSAADSLGVAEEDAVAIEATRLVPARRIVAAPVAEMSVRGGEQAVREAFTDRPLIAGDDIPVSFLNGTLELPIRVTETVPKGPVAIGSETELVLEAGPAADPTGDTHREPLPEAAVGGYDDTIARIQATVVNPLIHADAYTVDGQSAASGVLISGRAGVGKTHLLRHAAWLADAEIVSVDCTELSAHSAADLGDWLDTISVNAVAAAPAIVHLDNLGVLADRGDDALVRRLGAWIERTVKRDEIVVVGECVDAEDIDEVLTRGGRLARHLTVPSPSVEDRHAILRKLFAGLKQSSAIDLKAVSERTLGYVAADLHTLRARAIEAAITRRAESEAVSLQPTDIETAINETAPTIAEPTGSVPSISFDDIGGLAEAKRELTRAVEWPLKHQAALDRLGVAGPAGVLLYGPPGTGKTMLARAVASTTDANFLPVDGPELLNKYVGESERRVRQLFDRARDSAPAVIFFDELDALGAARSDDGGDGAPERVVSQLLTELDGLEPRERVTVIGATNRPDRIDDALIRPGRFDRIVEVPLPDAEARREIIRIHARDRPIESLDVDALVRQTEGYSGSDIASLFREASLLAMETYIEEQAAQTTGEVSLEHVEDLRVTRAHIDRALNRVGPSLSAQAREEYAAFNPDGNESEPTPGS